MQSDDAVSIRFSDEFEEKLYRLSKRFRNIRSDVQLIIEELQQGNIVGEGLLALVSSTLFTRSEFAIVIFKRVKALDIA